MKLYVGSREFAPHGFKTLDVDPARTPDFLCDATNLRGTIETESVDLICASAILEHIDWPDALSALSEWMRVLRMGGRLQIMIPDFKALALEAIDNGNPFHAIGMLYGVGGRSNPLERHRYAYTRPMLGFILTALGGSTPVYWHHDLPDASNGWMTSPLGNKSIGINLEFKKIRDPIVTIEVLLSYANASLLDGMQNLSAAFDHHELRFWTQHCPPDETSETLHYDLIVARRRIERLEQELSEMRRLLELNRS